MTSEPRTNPVSDWLVGSKPWYQLRVTWCSALLADRKRHEQRSRRR